MTASTLITILSKCITLYGGDKPVLIRQDRDDTYYELMLGWCGDFHGTPKHKLVNKKKSKYIILDMDLI